MVAAKRIESMSQIIVEDLSKTYRVAERQPGLRHRPYLLFLGRIHPKKGVDLLLQAWLALAERSGSMPALVIAGPGVDQAGGPGGSLLVYTWYLYEQGFQRLSMGYASAMAWMLLLGIAVVTIILFRSQRYWVYYEEEAR